MSYEVWKSGQWRICSTCLASITPKDKVGVLYDEIVCLTCLTEENDETERTNEESADSGADLSSTTGASEHGSSHG